MKFLSVLTAVLTVLLILPAGALAAVPAAAVLLSPGLSVIAASCELVVSAAPDGEAVFTRADFERAAGRELSSVTVVTVPDPVSGQLVSGSVLVPAGQTLTGADIARLAFVPTSAVADGEGASFTFSADGSPYCYTCRIFLSDAAETNRAPTLACATAAARSVRTFTDRVCSGLLAGSDPDGDALTFELVSYPSHGSVTLTEPAGGGAGRFVYKPAASYAGKDSFEYTVRDSFGRYAEGSVKVSVSVSRYSPAADYADMSGAAESAALTVSAAGLMNGKQVGEEQFFEPERPVSRGEFLVMLMNAAGIGDLPDSGRTVFADDEEIADAVRPYVAAAYLLGCTDGWIVNGEQCFLPEENITAAEAAVMTAAVLGIGTDEALEVSADAAGGAPSWARAAVARLTSGGFPLTGFGGGAVTASAPLDRGSAAALLASVLEYVAA